MAKVNSQLLFLTTSPRTPEKMVAEISILADCFVGKKWDKNSQIFFMKKLAEADFYHGEGKNDPAFSARDRINRAPKSLGFVKLKPDIQLTPAGERLLYAKSKDEVFLRQMLKFQLPSPFHVPSENAAKFCVKPYLEILRLVRTLGTLKFDELQIFGMQLTDYHKFEQIVEKIETFRIEKAQNKGNYRLFKAESLKRELADVFQKRIASGETKTRESNDRSLQKFLSTQANNTRDYADACFRYLRATGLVAVSHIGKSLSVVPERMDEVDYILNTVSREPVIIDDEDDYLEYLGNAMTPNLLTDNRKQLVNKIMLSFPDLTLPEKANILELKDLLANALERKKSEMMAEQVSAIKKYSLYDDIQMTYGQITKGDLFDKPLLFEWNTWRAMTMIDGGDIKANLLFDDFGKPYSAAAGNMADIVCDYGDFLVSVEVTLSSGQRQFETEGESVNRHLGKMKLATGRPCYCLFIAPTINDACVSFFYMLHHLNVSMYGGTSIIVPLPLNVFQKMIEDSYKAKYIPGPRQVRDFFENSGAFSKQSENECDWYNKIIQKALHWLD